MKCFQNNFGYKDKNKFSKYLQNIFENSSDIFKDTCKSATHFQKNKFSTEIDILLKLSTEYFSWGIVEASKCVHFFKKIIS